MNWDPIIAAAIYMAICVFLGIIQRVDHDQFIRVRKLTPKMKREWTAARFVILGIMSVATFVLHVAPWWAAVALFIGGNAAFSAYFRRTLNKLEGWNRNYLGSTALYDLAMIALAVLVDLGTAPDWEALKESHQSAYQLSPAYRKTVHLGGRIATGIELTATGGAIVACVVAAFITKP